MANESQLTFSDIGSDTDAGTYTSAINLASKLFDTNQQSITVTTPSTDDDSETKPTYVVKTPPDTTAIDVSEHPQVTISSVQTKTQDETTVLITTLETENYTLKAVFPNEAVTEENTDEQNRLTYKQFKFKEFVDAYL